MKTIFHFNCVVCGAHPNERPFSTFAWPENKETLHTFLDALVWVLGNVREVGWAKRVFREAIARLLEQLGERGDIPTLHAFDKSQSLFTIQCPLCDTAPGPRPYDRYFRAWSAWHLVCGVQIGNLLFESKQLLTRELGAAPIVDALEQAMTGLGMQRCCCGRPTTMLYSDGLCRWCLDAGGPHISGPMQPGLASFLRRLDLSDFLCVPQEAWRLIRDALIRDNEEEQRSPEHLRAAMIGNPTGSWLGRWRETFRNTRSWPADWEETSLQEDEPPIPARCAECYEVYCQLPREITESPYHIQPMSPAIRAVLDQRGLLELGEPNEFRAYLEHLPISKVRHISNVLGAGRARSKHELIEKIMRGATGEQLTAALPEISAGWVKAIHSPFDALPGDWLEYQREKARLLRGFLSGKYQSWQAIRSGEIQTVDLSEGCPALCRNKKKSFRYSAGLSLDELPPWYPGCTCQLVCKDIS